MGKLRKKWLYKSSEKHLYDFVDNNVKIEKVDPLKGINSEELIKKICDSALNSVKSTFLRKASIDFRYRNIKMFIEKFLPEVFLDYDYDEDKSRIGDLNTFVYIDNFLIQVFHPNHYRGIVRKKLSEDIASVIIIITDMNESDPIEKVKFMGEVEANKNAVKRAIDGVIE